MNVFLAIIHHHYDSSDVLTVASTFKLAEKAIISSMKDRYGCGLASQSYFIEEYKVDGENIKTYYLDESEQKRLKKGKNFHVIDWKELPL